MAERSEAEREAARLERERRRAARSPGSPQPPEQTYEPAPAPPVEQAYVPPPPPPVEQATEQHTFEQATEQHTFEQPTERHTFEQPTEQHTFEFDDHPPGEAEAPSGTRRVSALERGHRRIGRLPSPQRPKGARRRPLRRRIGAVIALVLAGALIWFLNALFQPFIGSPSGKPFQLTIQRGWNVGQIGDFLERNGVISSSFFFGLRATLAGDRGDLRAGKHEFRKGMSYGSVLDILTTPPKPVPTTEVTIIPGKTRLQVGQLLSSQGVRGSYVAATRHSKLLNPRVYGAPRSTPDLEGFLFPDTYQLRKPLTIASLVADQLEQFKKQFATVDLRYARSKHLTPYDVLIIASMIESETPSPHDRAYVSAVIYNRLRLGMTLGIDATTRYATGNYTSPLTVSQLNSPSPYNTRIHAGLPPTPIDSPGLASIEAAAHPARSDALYFVATPCGNGRSTFTASYQQFLIDSQNYQRARAARGGRSPVNCKH